MSDYQVQVGWVAELMEPVDMDTPGVYDKLHGLGLFLNYEGTLIFDKQYEGEFYDFSLRVGMNHSSEVFMDSVRLAGHPVKPSVLPFFAVWYNGGDSPQSEYKLEQFHSRL